MSTSEMEATDYGVPKGKRPFTPYTQLHMHDEPKMPAGTAAVIDLRAADRAATPHNDTEKRAA